MESINVPAGTRAIIKVTLFNDKSGAFSHSYAILASLSMTGKLLDLSREPNNRNAQLLELLDSNALPDNFLALTASLLKKIHTTINLLIRKADTKSSLPLVSDFDKYVLSALGLSMSELIWTERGASDFSGPALKECLNRLNHVDRVKLIRTFTKHYIANIIQHYFEKAEVRRSVPDIPDDEEERIRNEDANVIAGYCLALLQAEKGSDFNEFDYMDYLKRTLETLSEQTDEEV